MTLPPSFARFWQKKIHHRSERNAFNRCFLSNIVNKGKPIIQKTSFINLFLAIEQVANFRSW